jgi:hypothetical protein
MQRRKRGRKRSKLLTPPPGVVLWSGPSLIDGKRIVVIATFRSANEKTGPMIQTWILRTDRSPIAAVATGADSSICGNCTHRGEGPHDRTCYVNYAQAPESVWHAWRRGVYPRFAHSLHAHRFAGRFLRMGAYGDPAAAPFEVWERVAALVAGWTGYTHQWRTTDARFAGLLMASCDSVADRDEAKVAGWRTFRVKPAAAQHWPAGEIVCPASEEAGKRLQCIECRACSGTRLGKLGSFVPDVVIDVHGSAVALRNYKRVALTIMGR